ncbi:hypothetical protein [Pseudomonas umsongensis]|jgi:hypothetical protein|uniref:hypothetical protein n=1 Tax=Pseudomonas umsongensis TaxID=198618 RepID=UPI0015BEAD26|nr:hypothetical protein [Pseudomonas umsongensis]NWL22032.1 hypothetical protein [Pseudomonas umsongensis]
MVVLVIALVSALVGVSGLALHFYGLTKDTSEFKGRLQPFDSTLVAWWAASFALMICLIFFFSYDQSFVIGNNIGQVGDFIGVGKGDRFILGKRGKGDRFIFRLTDINLSPLLLFVA